MCLCPYHQTVIGNYLETVNDDRVHIFGDTRQTKQRVSEKFETLLHQVFQSEGENVVTPHWMRHMIETTAQEKGILKPQIYSFTGHKDGETYIELTKAEKINIAKILEPYTTFNRQMVISESKTQEELLDSMITISQNRGKMETYVHLYTEIHDSPEKMESETPQKRIDMKISTLIHNITQVVKAEIREELYESLKADILRELQ